MMKKRQVFIIHGGGNFINRKEYLNFLQNFKIDIQRYKPSHIGWKQSLEKELGRGFEVFLPQMPNKDNAKYAEWALWFKKITKHIKDDSILIGHSLGASFLAKYLSKNEINADIKALFLIAGPYKSHLPYGNDFDPPKDLTNLQKRIKKIFIYHSKDDVIVPFQDSLKYKNALPMGTLREFKNRGHFIGDKIPELIKDIKNL